MCYSKDSNVNFTDEARFDSQLTERTFIKYDASYKLVSPRCLVKDIKPSAVEPWKIPKMDGVGPGSYQSPEAFDKTQKPKEFYIHKSTGKRTGFCEGISKLASKVPGVGTYKDIDRGFKTINKPTFETINEITKL